MMALTRTKTTARGFQNFIFYNLQRTKKTKAILLISYNNIFIISYCHLLSQFECNISSALNEKLIMTSIN